MIVIVIVIHGLRLKSLPILDSTILRDPASCVFVPYAEAG